MIFLTLSFQLVFSVYNIFFFPVNKEIINSTIKIKNRIFAILAAPAAIPPNPKIAAMMASTIKVIVQRNIYLVF